MRYTSKRRIRIDKLRAAVNMVTFMLIGIMICALAIKH